MTTNDAESRHVALTNEANSYATLLEGARALQSLQVNTAPVQTHPIEPKLNVKTINDLARDMPKFKNGDEADSFWHQFHTQIEAYRLDTHSAITIFQRLTMLHPRGPNWYHDYVKPFEANISLEQLKEKFYQAFRPPYLQALRSEQLASIRYRIGETVADFLNRFSELMRLNERSMSECSDQSTFHRDLLFNKMPPSVRRLLGVQSHLA
jgi:hypothetical protein